MRKYSLLPIGIVVVMLLSVVSPTALAKTNIKDLYQGYDKGVSWKPVVPVKKVTFVNFDEDSYLDDYAYLSAIPTAVFYDKEKDRLFSHPLLFYQDPYPVKDDKERSLDARKGIDYFMEDWMSYCNGRLDQMVLINVDKSKVEQWPAKDVVEINGDDPYEIASKIALHDWSYSDSVVIAVIDDDFERPSGALSGEIAGVLNPSNIERRHFEINQTNKLNPQFREFTVPDGYKYIMAKATFACVEYMVIPFIWIVIPSGDKDIQVYCNYEGKWMEVGAGAANTNQWGMDSDAERVKSIVYAPGKWRVAITDVPTEKVITLGDKEYRGIQRHGTWRELIRNLFKGVVYNVDVWMYPGVELPIPDTPPFECRNVTLKLTWDNPNVKLGFSLIGPGGEEVTSAHNESRKGYQEMHLDELGECLDGEHYSVVVFSMDNITTPVNFKIEYSWEQRIYRKEGDALSSATEGSILASIFNAPLLYVKPNKLPECTKDVLYKLGVGKIHLVDVGKHLSDKVKSELAGISKIKVYYKLEDIYRTILDRTGQNDIVFTTIDPWTYWYAEKTNRPAGEKEKAFYIGPASYIAAHHGCPVFIVDMHPQLSSAVVWHNEFWRKYSGKRVDYEPEVAEMYLTGKRVYDFIKELGFDKEGMESIITVAGQYDIGISWDRVFPGKATPGRFLGTPVDTAYAICRNVFYPALIFVNPALDPNGIYLINGSKSERRFPWWSGAGLRIIKESGEEKFIYPILQTFVSYPHRFNERVAKYYGFKYQTADGVIPGETNSFEAIDDGVNKKYTGEDGSFYPDLTPSEMVGFYAKKGGYSNVYSTNFTDVMEDLNRGAILWIHAGHGHAGVGEIQFWEPQAYFSKPIIKHLLGCVKERNPWRGYEIYLGSTEEPDTMAMEVHGIIPALLGNPHANGIFRTGVDWGPSKKPILDMISNVISKIPIVKRLAPDWLKDTQDYYDGFVNAVMFAYLVLKFHGGYEMDDSMNNLHSCGFLSGSCMPAGTFMHLSLIRHGSSFQIIDPWPTSWYGSMWLQSVVRDTVLGHTVGEAYTKGIASAGILYIGGAGKDGEEPQWWWDTGENICYFGDPDLRVWTPKNEYSDANHWEREDVKSLKWDGEKDLYVDGHMIFGASVYPYARRPIEISIIAAIVIIAVLVIAIGIAYYTTKKK